MQLAGVRFLSTVFMNKKHLKNVGPIRYCEPPAIAIAQAACNVHDINNNNDNNNDNNNNNNNDNAWQRGPLWPHGMGPTNKDEWKCPNFTKYSMHLACGHGKAKTSTATDQPLFTVRPSKVGGWWQKKNRKHGICIPLIYEALGYINEWFQRAITLLPTRSLTWNKSHLSLFHSFRAPLHCGKRAGLGDWWHIEAVCHPKDGHPSLNYHGPTMTYPVPFLPCQITWTRTSSTCHDCFQWHAEELEMSAVMLTRIPMLAVYFTWSMHAKVLPKSISYI